MYLPKKIIHDSSSGILSSGILLTSAFFQKSPRAVSSSVPREISRQIWATPRPKLMLIKLCRSLGVRRVLQMTWINGLRVATYQIDPNISKYTNEYRNLMKFTTYQWACNPTTSPATNE